VMECWSVGVLECWSDGVLECWSVGVLECWSVGVLGAGEPSIPLQHCDISPITHYSITPTLHCSNTPRVLALDVAACSVPMRDGELPIWVRHDPGHSSNCVLIEMTQKLDSANAEIQRSGKINHMIGRGQA
jgi:hypothetical protein